jgi:hypothetical protein
MDLSGACPYVSVWDGERFQRDNNILPQSERTAEDVSDHYLLRVPPKPDGREYRLRIEEFENEHTWADRFELAVIDRDPAHRIAVSDDGRIFTYQDLEAPQSVTGESGVNYTHLATFNDRRAASVAANEAITVNFGRIQAYHGARLIVGLDPGDGDDEDDPPAPDTRDQKVALKVSPHDYAKANSELTLQPRETGSVSVTDVSDLLPESGENFALKIEFPASRSVDFIGLDISEQVPVELARLPLISANHSESGDVTSSLTHKDGQYAELLPGEYIDLAFECSEPQPGSARDFILISTGRYRAVDAQQGDQKPGLIANYPNPFNPTTEIMFALTKPSHVTLDIYNIMGQKIATIVDEYRQAGTHRVLWNGTSDTGAPVASGMYFGKIKSDQFEGSIKMLLLK